MATAHRSQMLSDDQAEWHEAALVVSEKLEQPGVRPTAGHGECELDVGTPSTISNPMQSAPTKDAELRWKETAGRDPPSYTPPNRDMARAHFKDHRPRRIKDSKQPTGHRRAKQVKTIRIFNKCTLLTACGPPAGKIW